jgi:hypothetical protein
MGTGPGKILFLPWHKFMRFSFTDDRVWNPAEPFFRRDVIAGDNIELERLPTLSRSPRSAFLEAVFRRGTAVCRAGQLLAPLGVEYVVLAKAIDWKAYRWLDDQLDLEPVSDDADLVVYRNRSWVPGAGYRVDAVPGFPSPESAIRAAGCDAAAAPVGPARSGATRESPVAYRIAARPGRFLLLPEPYDDDWRLAGRRGRETVWGTVGFAVSPGRQGVARFTSWRAVAFGYLMSAGTLAGLLWVLFRARRRDARHPPTERLVSTGSGVESPQSHTPGADMLGNR